MQRYVFSLHNNDDQFSNRGRNSEIKFEEEEAKEKVDKKRNDRKRAKEFCYVEARFGATFVHIFQYH
jgi:hypothetical protein